jgi:hypothetical protein
VKPCSKTASTERLITFSSYLCVFAPLREVFLP